MRKIRENVFETNSSSVHTIVCKFVKDNTPYKGIVKAIPIEEESGVDLVTPLEKMEYMLTHLKYESSEENITKDERYKWMQELWFEETGSTLVYSPDMKSDHPFGYIGHQMINEFSEYFWKYEPEFKEKLKYLVFNSNISIEMSHD